MLSDLAGPLQHPPSSLDVHSLDHPILEPLRSAAESLDQPARTFDFVCAGPKGLVARADLVRVDQRLSVEAETAAVHALRDEAVDVC
jgi:hypothetical protein